MKGSKDPTGREEMLGMVAGNNCESMERKEGSGMSAFLAEYRQSSVKLFRKLYLSYWVHWNMPGFLCS